jgi:quercetin dioxygenase-like cupin family protein
MHARLFLFVVAVAGAMAGYGISPAGAASAQPQSHQPPEFKSVIPAPQLRQPIPMWPNQPKDATYWSIDDIRKSHDALAAAELSGKAIDPNATLHDFPYWTRTHSYFIVHVPRKPGASTAQQHAGYSQFIVIMGGAGKVITGGQLVKPAVLVDKGQPISGELRGAAVSGGETFTVVPGDWVSIPANMPAAFTADGPGGLTYMVMKVNAMLYPWDLIR